MSTVASIDAVWNKPYLEINGIGTSRVEQLFPTHPQGNRSTKKKIKPGDNAMFFTVRDFVHKKRLKRENITSPEVLAFLRHK